MLLTTESKADLLTLRLTLNGAEVERIIEPRELLLDFLRDRLGLKGAKRSCDMQVCGTCTVLLDGMPVSSCCTLAYEANNRSVTTIEGLSKNEELHTIQQAFLDTVAVQCGFCTSGMVLTVKSLLEQYPQTTLVQTKAYLDGNLCRCTGYWNILEAVNQAAHTMASSNETQT